MDEKPISLPGWSIVRVIGKGSFGTVYEIEKDNQFGESVRSALKVISIPETNAEIKAYRDEGYDDLSITAIFRSQVEDITKEFEVMNLLKGNSNIVSFEDHAIVQHENDPGYDVLIRMELLRSMPDYINQRYPGQPIPDGVVIKLGIDLSRALELCEKCRIIHRDIKPQNIFINDLGDFKLGDFGIAKVSDHTTKATKTGTYSYMAPEVYTGRAYNAQVDIYSLGLVMYWLLNERRGPFLPLPPAVPKPSQNSEALERRMSGEPLPAPKHGSGELRRIVLKACAFDPNDRYLSPAALKEDLERLSNEIGHISRSLPEENPIVSGRTSDVPEEDRTVGLFWGRRQQNTQQIQTGTDGAGRAGSEQNRAQGGSARNENGRLSDQRAVNQKTSEAKADASAGNDRNRTALLIAVILTVLLAAAIAIVFWTGCNKCESVEQDAAVPTGKEQEKPDDPTPGTTDPITVTPPPVTMPSESSITVPPTTPPPTTPPPTTPPTTPPPTTPPTVPTEFSFGGQTIRTGQTAVEVKGKRSSLILITSEEMDRLIRLCPNLTDLTLDYCCMVDYSRIGELVSLRHLQLRWTYTTDDPGIPLVNIDWISNLTNLTTLTVSYNKINDIRAIAELNNLEELSLGGNPLGDANLAWIENLPLRKVILFNCNLSNVSSLASIKTLETVHIGGNMGVTDVEPLKDLPNLTELNISYCPIGSLSPLYEFNRLNKLLLYRSKYAGYDYYCDLVYCPNLRTIVVGNKTDDDIMIHDALESIKEEYGLYYWTITETDSY